MSEIKIFQGPASGWKCAFCKGSGIQPRSLRSRCIACRGKGKVEFANPIKCPSCQGMGRTSPSSLLSCVRCRGVGVIEKNEKGGDTTDIIRERFGEITKRLRWTRGETEKKTKEVEKRLKPIRSFIKEVSAIGGKESLKRGKLTSGQILWLNKLINKIKKGWQSLWED